MIKKIYVILITIFFLIVIMVAHLFFGQNSLLKQQEVKENIALYKKQIDSLQEIIEEHKNTIDKLKNDSLYKESILRTHYGMSKKNEKAFQLVQ